VLPIALGESARDLAQKLNDQIEWHSWPMPHTLCLEEVLAMGEWLTARLK
jgi:phospholipase/carboxylesterase